MIDLKTLSPKQLQIIRESNSWLNITHGAVRAGKTVGINLRWLEYVLNSGPPGDLYMIGKTERALKRNVLQPLKELLQDDMQIVSGASEVYLAGRRIYIVGANDERSVGKIQGGTWAGAYGDEVTLWPESFFNMMTTRLSVEGAKFFGSANPGGPYHWLKKNFIDNKSIDIKSWHFELDDNPHLPEEYKKNLKISYTGVFYNRYIRGLWVLAQGAVYQRGPIMGDIADPFDFTDYIIGIDYGTSNPCTFGLFGFDNNRPPIYLIREYYYDASKDAAYQKTDSQYADDLEKFIDECGISFRRRIRAIYVDPSALSFITELKRRATMPRVLKAKNDVLPGIRFISELISKDQYFIDRSCQFTRDGYSAYVWDPKAQEKGEDKPLKKDDHICDRDRYAIVSYFIDKRLKSHRKKYYK